MLKDSAENYRTRPYVTKLGRGKAPLTTQEKGSGPQIIASDIESEMNWFYKQTQTLASRIYSWRELSKVVSLYTRFFLSAFVDDKCEKTDDA